MGRFRDAETALRRTLRLVAAVPEPDATPTRARVMITLAWTTVALHGRAEALDLLAEVRTLDLTPRLLALSHVQEAVVHVSVADWREALRALAAVGDGFDLLTTREQTSALLNRGLSHLSLLELQPARSELEQALALAIAHRVPEQEFKARHNLGCLEFYAGHLPEAIRLMRAADEMQAGVLRARAKHDLALVLLEAGLLDEAQDTLAAALGEARGERLRLEEGDIRLDLAVCATLHDDPALARRELQDAIRAYRSRGARQRQHSTALLRASVDVRRGVVPRGVDALVAHWLDDARPVTPDERLAARVQVESLLLRGDVEGAERGVRRLGGQVRQGLAGDMHDQLLVAKVATARGDAPRARRAVRTALHRLTARQIPTQSLEIRSALALHGRRLSEFDVGDAVESGSARRVFDSVERWRAVSHRLPPVSAPSDAVSAELMAELRLTRRSLRSGDEEVPALRARAAELEWQIAQRDRAAGDLGGGGQVARAATLGSARDLLGARDEHALVLFTHGGSQFALHVDGRGARLHDLGSLAEVTHLAERLLRDVRAHAFTRTNAALEQVLRRAVASSLEALDRQLFSALDLDPGAGVVVVPGQALSSVPWGMLPTLTGRPVTVSPSVTRWSSPLPARGADEAVRTSALAGPGLRRAAAEVSGVLAAWSADGVGAVREGGGRPHLHEHAGSSDVRTALSDATVVHVAAHGTHQEESPFFSSLHMADGPVFAHELPHPVGAEHVVLSACDVGRSDLRPGDEPLGLTAALLALGVHSVVAAVAPVQDSVAEVAMVSYHRHLADGIPASRALARAITEHPDAGAFCLYGADWTRGG